MGAILGDGRVKDLKSYCLVDYVWKIYVRPVLVVYFRTQYTPRLVCMYDRLLTALLSVNTHVSTTKYLE